MLISFEGIDGCGKSTQIQFLKEKLTRDGKTVHVFREPGGTELSETIRTILLNPEITMNAVTETLLFSAARSQLIGEWVLPALERGEIVILDRFFDSTTAYQGYARKAISLDEIHKLNQIAAHGIKPDITYYIKVSLETSWKRTAHSEKDRMEQSGNEFYQDVLMGFDELAKKDARFVIVDGEQRPEAVHQQVFRVLEKFLD